jgi:hypothetical protein
MNRRANRHPTRTASLWVVLASIGVATGVGACSTQDGNPGPGDGVVIAGTSHVIWKSAGGGYGVQVPAGAACHFEATYDLDMHAGSLSWSLCKVTGNDFSDPSAYSTFAGSRTLSAEERAQATAAATAVKVSNANSCGADLDSRSLEVEGTSGAIVYGDDFYACQHLFQQYVFSSQLQSLRNALDGMAHSP